MNQTDDLLDNSKYFYCERASCKLRVEICIQRQNANIERHPNKPIPFLVCQGCNQGVDNKLLANFGGGMPPVNLMRGEGQKNLNCDFYNRCLDLAAKKSWQSFNCESCDLFKTKSKEKVEASKMNDKKLCEKCGENPPINRFSKYCPGCLNSFKKDKAKGPEASKKKKKGHDKRKPEKAPKRANAAITIEFGKYASILQEVEKLADEEMRPLDLQIAYMLKSQLKAR